MYIYRYEPFFFCPVATAMTRITILAVQNYGTGLLHVLLSDTFVFEKLRIPHILPFSHP